MFNKKEFIGEFIGTFLLMLIGLSAGASSALFGALQGILQLALVWGIAVSLAIYAATHLSNAHFNPAVTLAMAASKRMGFRKVPVYLAAQFAGAFTAALIVYALFGPSIASFESAHHIVRGTMDSMQTAKLFGEYYTPPVTQAVVSMPLAVGAESLGTFLLILIVFFLAEGSNLGKLGKHLPPVLVGLTITVLICVFSPLTQAGLNPARDFGPRLVTWIFGWGDAAFPDQSGGFFLVYILGPIAGGQAAAFLFTYGIKPLYGGKKERRR